METFMPCPAFGLWVWQASPAMNTRGKPSGSVELVAKALADLVNRPPGDLLHLQRIGMQDPPRRGDQIVGRDVQARGPFVLIEFLELDVEADEITAFAWNDQEAAFIGRLDRRLEANVGEVGDGQDIHYAPGLIGRIPIERQPERPADGAARAVAADDEPGLDGFRLPLRARRRAVRTWRSP